MKPNICSQCKSVGFKPKKLPLCKKHGGLFDLLRKDCEFCSKLHRLCSVCGQELSYMEIIQNENQ